MLAANDPNLSGESRFRQIRPQAHPMEYAIVALSAHEIYRLS
jgi:hypothetical protein